MSSKSVPLSVRITPDDAEFLARLRVDQAATPSEKLRALVREERRRREGYRSYGRVLRLTSETLAPTLERIRTAENTHRIHSELVHTVEEWLPDLMAFVLTSMAETPEGDERQALLDMEDALADRVFRLVEAVLRLAVTRQVRGYDPDVVARRIGPILELAELIRRASDDS